MKRTVVTVIASAAIAAGASVAFAQQNPASNTKINDGINGAPNYNPMAPAGGGTTAASKISDGVNGAPNYGSATTAAAPKAATIKSAHQHAHHRKPAS